MNVLPILFVLLGYNNEVDASKLEKKIESFYSIKVDVIITPKMPKSAYYSARNRYRADSILNYFKKTYPGKRVVGLTSYDISTTKGNVKDWGVFGLGSLVENVSITSTYRLKSKNLEDRVEKVILHEMGHSYGLFHCTSGQPCFMIEGDHTTKTVDSEPKNLCSSCVKKLTVLRRS